MGYLPNSYWQLGWTKVPPIGVMRYLGGSSRCRKMPPTGFVEYWSDRGTFIKYVRGVSCSLLEKWCPKLHCFVGNWVYVFHFQKDEKFDEQLIKSCHSASIKFSLRTTQRTVRTAEEAAACKIWTKKTLGCVSGPTLKAYISGST